MTRTPGCPRAADVLDLVWTRQWPARADAALRAHVAGCAVCADLATVATAIGDLHESTSADVKVPDAGVVWYSAQVRARQDLARRAARPVLVAELAAVACGAVGALVAWRAGGQSIVAWWGSLPAPSLPPFPDWSGALTLAGAAASPWVVGTAIAWALVVPAALYVARFADRTTEQPHDRS